MFPHAGERIKDVLAASGMSVSKFARELNCHRQKDYDIGMDPHMGLKVLINAMVAMLYDFGSSIGFSEMEIASNIAEAIQKNYVPSMESIC